MKKIYTFIILSLTFLLMNTSVVYGSGGGVITITVTNWTYPTNGYGVRCTWYSQPYLPTWPHTDPAAGGIYNYVKIGDNGVYTMTLPVHLTDFELWFYDTRTTLTAGGATYKVEYCGQVIGTYNLQTTTSPAAKDWKFSFSSMTCDCFDYELAVNSTTKNSATLNMTAPLGETNWTLEYGQDGFAHGTGTAITTSNTEIVLSGLQACECYTAYIYPVGNANYACNSVRFKTKCNTNPACIDFTNLHACTTTCKSWRETYSPPYSTTKVTDVVDFGPSNKSSLHTVNTNPDAYDAQVGGTLLRTVPPGASASVRLGSWEALLKRETITYEYTVDVSVSDLLIFKYAAVQQSMPPPGMYLDRPRIGIDLLYPDGTPIYSEKFIYDPALGWNVRIVSPINAIYWKDWTTVEIDLSALDGETIYIQVESNDCLESSSFYGYMYFTLGCGRKISNQKFHFACPGGVTITYDLGGTCSVEDLTLWYSADMSSWAKAITVTGDVGTVAPGKNKTILWDNATDKVRNGNFYFKISYTPLPPCY